MVGTGELPLTFGAYALPSYHVESDPPQGVFLRRLIDLLALAEPLGFDSIWLNEHHFNAWGGMLPSPPMVLAALSQRTRRVRLGTSVAVLGLHHPIEMAEQLAMLDLMSGGRLDFGVGRGSAALDYQVMGLEHAEAQARTLEALAVILEAWQGAPFTFRGTYFDIPKVSLWPLPEQQPHPPVWISCSGTAEHFAWTARQGYHLLTIGFVKPVPRFAELVRAYRQAWAAAGHAPGGYQIGTLYHSVICEDGDRARAMATAAIGRLLGQLRRSEQTQTGPARPSPIEDLEIERMVEQARLVAGNPRDVAEMLRYLRSEVGFTQVNLMFQFGGLGFDVARQSMELFAREVIPQLRQPATATAAA